MKKVFTITCLCFMVAIIPLFGLSRLGKAEKELNSSENATHNMRVLKGYVRVYGNEPFTFLGFRSIEGEEFSLDADNETLAQMRLAQGTLIELSGFIQQADSTVESWKVKSAER